MSRKEFDQKLSEAIDRVSEMDRVDGRKDRRVKTIIAALSCGIQQPHTNAQFDALAMLMTVDVIGNPTNN